MLRRRERASGKSSVRASFSESEDGSTPFGCYVCRQHRTCHTVVFLFLHAPSIPHPLLDVFVRSEQRASFSEPQHPSLPTFLVKHLLTIGLVLPSFMSAKTRTSLPWSLRQARGVEVVFLLSVLVVLQTTTTYRRQNDEDD